MATTTDLVALLFGVPAAPVPVPAPTAGPVAAPSPFAQLFASLLPPLETPVPSPAAPSAPPQKKLRLPDETAAPEIMAVWSPVAPPADDKPSELIPVSPDVTRSRIPMPFVAVEVPSALPAVAIMKPTPKAVAIPPTARNIVVASPTALEQISTDVPSPKVTPRVVELLTKSASIEPAPIHAAPRDELPVSAENPTRPPVTPFIAPASPAIEAMALVTPALSPEAVAVPSAIPLAAQPRTQAVPAQPAPLDRPASPPVVFRPVHHSARFLLIKPADDMGIGPMPVVAKRERAAEAKPLETPAWTMPSAEPPEARDLGDASIPSRAEATWPEVVEHVGREAPVALRDAGRAEFHFSVSPPEMGQIRVRLVTTSEGVTAELSVVSDAAREMVEARLPELRERLESAGVTVGSFSVKQEGGARRDSSTRWDEPTKFEDAIRFAGVRTTSVARSGLVDVTA